MALRHRLDKFFGIEDSVNPRITGPKFEHGAYVEKEPTTADFFREHHPTVDNIKGYLHSLFPFLGWIAHYNLTWLFGDLIAGITVGFVVVPQGMAYALLANLPAEYGLYTSFVGFLLYWAFATSKDITIGAVAVMSTIVGNVVLRVQAEHPEISADNIARALALVSGCVLLFLGLIRAGFIVEFIPLIAIASFMTGAALSIGVGQVPTMMGITGVNTRDPTYLVIINTLKGLPRTKLDAAMGLSALFLLYFIRYFCNFMGRKQPQRSKMWFFISTLRMAFVMIIYILISWGANRNVGGDAKKAKFKILGPVPSGFQHKGAPNMDRAILEAIAPDIPVTIIVLIIEHIAISKSFGRVNNYIINPSQELVAIGFTNVFGPFLGGYPATGSFSRTAIKAKAGVRTPLAGIFTAVIVLLALYALTAVFFFIPSASLSAIIIHAVGDLLTPPREVYNFWRVSPLEVIIFFAGVLLTVFTNIENGIYLTMAASFAVLLFRTAKSPGRFLGEVKVFSSPRDTLRGGRSEKALVPEKKVHDAFLAFDRSEGSNPEIEIKQPHPGVFVYRFGEGFNYINSARHLDKLTIHIFNHTRRTELNKFEKIGDRPWNDPGPRRGKAAVNAEIASRPVLKAVVLDFSAVNFIDVTSAQALVDLRKQFGRYAAPDIVEWHFAGVTNRWTKRALVASGFGYDLGASADDVDEKGASGPLVAVADLESGSSSSSVDVKGGEERVAGEEIEPVAAQRTNAQTHEGKLVPVYGVNRPYFHVDLATAVEAAVRSASGGV
ncbi:sulfate permease [Coniochaeta sp. PMI_546]|nr:sulfate permease [Coniochaeta sp. PMI_546]